MVDKMVVVAVVVHQDHQVKVTETMVMLLVVVTTVVDLMVDLVTVVRLSVLKVLLELFGVTVERSHLPT